MQSNKRGGDRVLRVQGLIWCSQNGAYIQEENRPARKKPAPRQPVYQGQEFGLDPMGQRLLSFAGGLENSAEELGLC